MRRLNKRQQNYLRELYRQTGCVCVDDMPAGCLDRLIRMNDYETLYHDADRYLGDLGMDSRYPSSG